jgi:hypothetical protein
MDDITIHVNQNLAGQLSIPEADLPEDTEGSGRYMRVLHYIDNEKKVTIVNISEGTSHQERVELMKNANWKCYQLFSVHEGVASYTSGVIENMKLL